MVLHRPLEPGDRLINLEDLRVPPGTHAVVEHVRWIGTLRLRVSTVRARTVTAPSEVIVIDWTLGRWNIVTGVDTPTDATWRAA